MHRSKALHAALRHNLRQALAQGRMSEAEAIMARLKKEDPLGRETRGLELELHLNANRLVEAEALAQQLCRLFPDSGRIFFLAGKAAYRLKRYGEAEGRFRESLRIYPSRQTRHWLGKTLTQLGSYDEAESLLLSACEHTDSAFLDLAWLYERKQDPEAALNACNRFLETHPENAFAKQQRMRLKARMLEPEDLIEEVNTLSALGGPVADPLLPEFLQRLFDTGQSLRAREEIAARLVKMDERLARRIAWICYRAGAYDFACTLWLTHLESNVSNYKCLAALESAAAKCSRLQGVLTAYRKLSPHARQLYGRIRSLARKNARSR